VTRFEEVGCQVPRQPAQDGRGAVHGLLCVRVIRGQGAYLDEPGAEICGPFHPAGQGEARKPSLPGAPCNFTDAFAHET